MKQFLRNKERIISTHSIVEIYPSPQTGDGKLVLSNGKEWALTPEEWDNFLLLVSVDIDRLDISPRRG